MQALTVSQRKFCEMTYADVEKLIIATVNDFRARYGGDFSDLMSTANLIFMQVYQGNFDPAKSKFSSWLRQKLWFGLQSDMRKRYLDASREQARDFSEMPAEMFALEAADLDCWDLSDDAEMLLAAAFDHSKGGIAYGLGPRNKRMDVGEIDRKLD